MRFQVFDVGHGLCAYAIAENGNVMLIDCGHKTNPSNRPSEFLPLGGCTGIEWLFITNYDEDHISDLPALRKRLPINVLMRNNSITSEQLRNLKLRTGPLTPAMESLLDMLNLYSGDAKSPPPLPGIEFRTFCNRFGSDFDDTNNNSLVVFLHMGGLSVIVPGDLELPGWKALLSRQEFRNQLNRVNVFIASHHGRENGYCPDVFTYCHPDVIVFSDGPIQYETQDMSKIYSQHASGVTFDRQERKVLTTRNDGTLTWKI